MSTFLEGTPRSRPVQVCSEFFILVKLTLLLGVYVMYMSSITSKIRQEYTEFIFIENCAAIHVPGMSSDECSINSTVAINDL